MTLTLYLHDEDQPDMPDKVYTVEVNEDEEQRLRTAIDSGDGLLDLLYDLDDERSDPDFTQLKLDFEEMSQPMLEIGA